MGVVGNKACDSTSLKCERRNTGQSLAKLDSQIGSYKMAARALVVAKFWD